MLPFLKNKYDKGSASIIMKTREPDEKTEESGEDQDDHSAAIESCAAALISAIHAHDIKGAAEAIQDAFTILDSLPHEEGEHEPHSYSAQNEAAGED